MEIDGHTPQGFKEACDWIDEYRARIDRALELLDTGPDCDDLDGWKGLAKAQADLLDDLRAALLGPEGE